MNYIYLDDADARKLFLNKYLSKSTFKGGSRKKTGVLSFHFGNNQKPIETMDSDLVFLSQFDYVNIDSKDVLKVYAKNYNVPVGFLHSDNKRKKSTLPFAEEESSITIDHKFLAIRRALLNSFLVFYGKGIPQIKQWFELYSSIKVLPDPFFELFQEIINSRELPTIKATGQLAKETKSVLQYIYFGRYLGKHFFEENNEKLDEKHKKWFEKLNPEEEMDVDKIPPMFKSIAEPIIGYNLAIKEMANERKRLRSSDYYPNSKSFRKKGEVDIYTIRNFTKPFGLVR